MTHSDFTVVEVGAFTTARTDDGDVVLHIEGMDLKVGDKFRLLHAGNAQRSRDIEELEDDGIDLDGELDFEEPRLPDSAHDDFLDQISDNEISIAAGPGRHRSDSKLQVTENQVAVLRFIRNNPGTLFGELIDGLGDCGFDVNSSLRKLIGKGLIRAKKSRHGRGNTYTVVPRLQK